MTKSELRKVYRQRRAALTAEDYKYICNQIHTQLFQTFDFSQYTYLHTYLSSNARKEADTWPILHRLLHEYPQLIVSVPQLIKEDSRMINRHITPTTKLVAHTWGIQEPVEGAVIDASQLDIALLPLLAFDQQGYRLGYGKGHYDRFLANIKPTTLLVGLCLEAPMDEIPECHVHDLQMDYCITPTKVFCFKK